MIATKWWVKHHCHSCAKKVKIRKQELIGESQGLRVDCVVEVDVYGPYGTRGSDVQCMESI